MAAFADGGVIQTFRDRLSVRWGVCERGWHCVSFKEFPGDCGLSENKVRRLTPLLSEADQVKQRLSLQPCTVAADCRVGV